MRRMREEGLSLPEDEEEEEEWGGTQPEPHVMGGTQPDEDEDEEEGGTMASGTDPAASPPEGASGVKHWEAAEEEEEPAPPQPPEPPQPPPPRQPSAETLAALNKPAVQFGTNKRALEEGGGGADAFLNPRKVSRAWPKAGEGEGSGERGGARETDGERERTRGMTAQGEYGVCTCAY